MRSKTDYALRGSLYEVQKTLEAFFGRCEVTVREDIPQRVVMDELHAAKKSASTAMNHFR
jgi:hypothetical protein